MYSLFDYLKIFLPYIHGPGTPYRNMDSEFEEIFPRPPHFPHTKWVEQNDPKKPRPKIEIDNEVPVMVSDSFKKRQERFEQWCKDEEEFRSKMGLINDSDEIERDILFYGRRLFGQPFIYRPSVLPSFQRDPIPTKEYNAIKTLNDSFMGYDPNLIKFGRRTEFGYGFSNKLIFFYFFIFLLSIAVFAVSEEDDVFILDDIEDFENVESIHSANSIDCLALESLPLCSDIYDFDEEKGQIFVGDVDNDTVIDVHLERSGDGEFDIGEAIIDVEYSIFSYNPVLYNVFYNNITFSHNFRHCFDLLIDEGFSSDRYLSKRLWADFYLLMFDGYFSAYAAKDFSNLKLSYPFELPPFTHLELNTLFFSFYSNETLVPDAFGLAMPGPVETTLFLSLELHKLIAMLEFSSSVSLSISMELLYSNDQSILIDSLGIL